MVPKLLFSEEYLMVKILDKSISIQCLIPGNIRHKFNNWDQGNYQVRHLGELLNIEDIPDDSLTNIDPNHTDTPPNFPLHLKNKC